MNAEWKAWRPERLPILPSSWPLVVRDAAADQFSVVAALLTDRGTERIVAATDAGREGELIFRYVYERAGATKPFDRLWISSLTESAIRRGFERLRDGREFDGLAAAARARSRADWLVGMNLSRAYSLAHGDKLSVGRVQTPTLAMLVERERAMRDFVPEPYLEVEIEVAASAGTYRAIYHQRDAGDEATEAKQGKPRFPKREQARLPADGALAERILARARAGAARVHRVVQSVKAIPPPLLYDLTELQRHANRLYGFTAQRTLELAQALYEKHKVLSYPRTDSRHLSVEVAGTLPSILEVVAPRYPGLVAEGASPLSPRFVDDAKVTDHHAIVPTTTKPRLAEGSDEAKLYDLVCRRLLAAYHPDCLEALTTVETRIAAPDAETGAEVDDAYLTRGVAIERPGWKVLELGASRAPDPAETPRIPPGLEEGQPVRVEEARALEKKTRPPSPHTEATLLTAMETCGRTVDEKAIVEAMRDSGIGTPATRAAIIETLLARGYVERAKKTLRATPKGERLIDVVHAQVKSPAMTGAWELKLRQMERRAGDFDDFMQGIEAYVREVVGSAFAGGGANEGGPRAPEAPRREPVPPDALGALLREHFGFDGFRPHQEAICRTIVEGSSALVVMPTGAGKSLCFQLPGLARAGTTLVISPLIALIEDQVEKLRAAGLAASRIHSGMDRAESRRVCIDYLAGRLDFLFIAPERLSVQGFPEMLAKRKPVLVAVDEAHCISHWGHDFRPDYRMIAERLEPLRPVPIVALTATATPLVQKDIVDQLDIAKGREFIYGFRRENIAVEVVEAAESERAAHCEAILSGEGRLPAIVYVPTRKESEAIAQALGSSRRAAAYHAGLPPEARSRVQEAFLKDDLEIIVATVAFGMGVDKPNVRTVVHAGLPGSLEGYYQEIGRAGRDGAPSRAILLHGFADVRTHRFFFERDYPELERMAKLYGLLGPSPRPKASLERALGVATDEIDRMLDKLWLHGGAQIDPEENVRRGDPAWEPAYRDQRDHREAQVDRVMRFVGSSRCRMLDLVDHFGDREDDGTPCGTCDVCDPDGAVAARTRGPTEDERAALERMASALGAEDGQALGKLFRDAAEGSVSRASFQRLVQGLGRAGLLRVRDESFQKDGRTVRFQRVFRSARDPKALKAALDEVRVPVGPAGSTTRSKSRKKPAEGSKGRARGRERTAALASAADVPRALVDALRTWRLETAKREGVPAFRVLTDRQLLALAKADPRDRGGLLELSGFGQRKVERYGDALLEILRDG
jgi:DNA topoisomerase-3